MSKKAELVTVCENVKQLYSYGYISKQEFYILFFDCIYKRRFPCNKRYSNERDFLDLIYKM